MRTVVPVAIVPVTIVPVATLALTVPLALAVALAIPSLVQAQVPNGWEVFSTDEVYPPSSEVAFTIGYPAGFKRSIRRNELGYSVFIDEMSLFNIQDFHGVNKSDGVITDMTMDGNALDRSSVDDLREMSHETYVDLIREVFVSRSDDILDNSLRFTFKGNRAVDLYLHGYREQETYVYFSIIRVIFKGSHQLGLSCGNKFPSGLESVGWKSSGKNPGLEKVCRPFLDSLEFLN
jgi:hypothetical protein